MARVGSVGYLNARPLTDRINIDKHTVTLAHPAAIARMLAAREVDAALVPVAAVLSDGGLKVVPGVCIGAYGPVASVLLAAETPPEQWTRVLLDGVSRTSVILAELLLKRGTLKDRVSRDLEIVHTKPGEAMAQAKRTTAALVIGDAALSLPQRFTVRVDLAAEWREWTGLPFVFAVWAAAKDLDETREGRELVSHLEAAGKAGVSDIETHYTGAERDYLTKNIRYALDDDALTGLRRFASLARKQGLLPEDTVELFGPSKDAPRPDTDLLLSRALDGGALPPGEIAALLGYAPIADLCAAAELKRRTHLPGDEIPYRLAAELPAGAPTQQAAAAISAGASVLRLTGPLSVERVAEVRAAFPGLVLTGGGPSDGDPAALAAAGLHEIAEEPVGSLADRLRTDAPQASVWRLWAERAHKAGLAVRATVAVGRGETLEELTAHLLALASMPYLRSVRVWAADSAGRFGEVANTASDHLRALALARLVLPGHVSLVASPETEGWGITQCSLRSGCDSLGDITLTGDPERDSALLETLAHQVGEAGLAPARRAS